MVASKEVLHCEHAGQPLCVRECNGMAGGGVRRILER